MTTFIGIIQRPCTARQNPRNYRLTVVVPATTQLDARELIHTWMNKSGRADHKIVQINTVEFVTVVKA